MSDKDVEQRMNIKFCVGLGKSASETLDLLRRAYGAEAMKKSSVYEWHRIFKGVQDDVKDYAKNEEPQTSVTIEKVEKD